LGSRVTVFRIIDDFEPDVIEVKKFRRNSMKHPLHLKEGNILITTLESIQTFESSFIPLLNEVKKIYVEDYREWRYFVRSYKAYPKIEGRIDRKSNLSPSLQVKGGRIELNRLNADAMFEECIAYFSKVTQAYLIKSMMVWPYQISNQRMLKKLIPAVFNRLFTIQQTMSQIISEAVQIALPEFEDASKKTLNEMVSNSFYKTIKDRDSEDYWNRHKAFKRDGSYVNVRHELSSAVEKAVKAIVIDLRPPDDKQYGYDPALDFKG